MLSQVDWDLTVSVELARWPIYFKQIELVFLDIHDMLKKMQWSFLLASKLGLLNQNFTLLDQTDQFSSIRICCLFQRKKTCPV